MWRWVWALALSVFLVAAWANTAWAQGLPSELRVCARPPNVPPGAGRWAYPPSGLVVLTTDPAQFKRLTQSQTVFVFDPLAPPDSVRVLPIPYNTLPCAKYVLPAKIPTLPSVSAVPPAGATPLPKGTSTAAGDSRPAGDSKSAPKDKQGDAEGTSDPLPKPIYRPPLPPQEEHPALPSNGVTASWPRTVLPIKHRAATPGVQSGTGDAPNAVAKKSSFDKFAEEMAYAAAIANLEPGSFTRRLREGPKPQREGRTPARRAETDCPSVERPSTEVRASQQRDRDFHAESS